MVAPLTNNDDWFDALERELTKDRLKEKKSRIQKKMKGDYPPTKKKGWERYDKTLFWCSHDDGDERHE